MIVVFGVIAIFKYEEGEYLQGMFSTQEKAEKFIDEHVKQYYAGSTRFKILKYVLDRAYDDGTVVKEYTYGEIEELTNKYHSVAQ